MLNRTIDHTYKRIFAGIVIGLSGITVMANTIPFMEGIVFDSRSILLSTSALYFGPLPAIIAAVITGIYRYNLGGIGTLAGISTIIVTTSVGIVWHVVRQNEIRRIKFGELIFFGCCVHLLMILCMLVLPTHLSKEVLKHIFIPVMIIYPAGTVLLATLLSTQLKRQDQDRALAESEQKYRQIVDTANEGIWAMDNNHKTSFVNERMAKMLGYEVYEIMGKDVLDFVCDSDIPDHTARMQSREMGLHESYERRLKHKNGNLIWTLVSGTAILDSHGKFEGSFGMFTDITERKNLEEQLRFSEERHRITLMSVGDGVIATDSEGKIELVNPVAENMTGWNSQDACGRKLEEVFSIINERTGLPVETPVVRIMRE